MFVAEADFFSVCSELRGRSIYIIKMDPSQMRYVILRWTSNAEKLSVEHLKCIEQQPKKQYYNDYSAEGIVTAKFDREEMRSYIQLK